MNGAEITQTDVEVASLAFVVLSALVTGLVKFIRMTDKIDGLQQDVKYLAREVDETKKQMPDFHALQAQINHLTEQNDEQLKMLREQREWMLLAGFRPDGSFSERTPTGPGGRR